MATVEQPPVVSGPEQVVKTNGRWSGYARLLQMRMLEMWREPEVIFWVFVFPLLLALGLGIAFRQKPADVTPVAVVAGAQTAAGDRSAAALARARRHSCRYGERCGGARRLPRWQVCADRQHGRCGSPFPLRSCASGERARPPAGRRCVADLRRPQESHPHGRAKPPASRARATSTSSSPACWA